MATKKQITKRPKFFKLGSFGEGAEALESKGEKAVFITAAKTTLANLRKLAVWLNSAIAWIEEGKQ